MGKRSPSLVKGKPRFCLGEGSYSSSLGVLSTTLSQACFSTGHLPTRPVVYPRVPGWPQPIPASTSPSPDQASCLRAPPAPDHPMCVWVTCHHVLSARGRVGQGGTWGPVRDQRGRENGEAGSRGRQQALRPGERRHRVLDVVGRRLWPQRRHLVVVEGAPF